MRVFIIEDEAPAQRRLQKMLLELKPDCQIVGMADSIETAVSLFGTNRQVDLVFMDIELADGQSFEIFNQTQIAVPVVFTTAYDAFALRAFAVNSIDYLLKPIRPEDLQRALHKWEGLHQSNLSVTPDIQAIVQAMKPQSKTYKSRFLVRLGEKYVSLAAEQIAYFTTDEKLVMAITTENKKYPIDFSLDELEDMLDPARFFRINRQFFGQISAIQSIHNYFNGKLKLVLQPPTPPDKEVVVSRERATIFKNWLDQ